MSARLHSDDDSFAVLQAYGATFILIMLGMLPAFGFASATAHGRADDAARAHQQVATLQSVSAYARTHGYVRVALVAGEAPTFARADGSRTQQVTITGHGRKWRIDRSVTVHRFRDSRAADLLLMTTDTSMGECTTPDGAPDGVEVCGNGHAGGLVVKLTGR